MVLGITGGIGSGKSTVTGLLQNEYGFLILSTDDIAKSLEEPGEECYEKLAEAFGEVILASEDGCPADHAGSPADPVGNQVNRAGHAPRRIDKAKFAALIYGDPEAKKKAEEILHPATWSAVEDVIARRTAEMHCGIDTGAGPDGAEGLASDPVRIAVETALPDARYRRMCDEIWYVYVDAGVRITRLMDSRGYSREKCLAIIGEQIPEEAYLSMADYTVDNSGGFAETAARVAELFFREGESS